MKFVLGIDLGGTSVKAAAAETDGTVIIQKNQEFDPSRPMHWGETIKRTILEITEALKGEPFAMGLSAPGIAAPNGSAISFMPGRLQGLEGLVWTDYLQSPQPVAVLNDAQAALMGEVWVGAARNVRNVIMLTLGTGVGGAAMVDGNLLKGHIGRAGHLGHACLDPNGQPDITGMPGALEDAIGNWTIERRTQGRFKTTHELVLASRAGDTEATGYWLKSVRYLACAIGTFINILDPQLVLIGGGIARSGDALFEPLRKYVSEVEWRPGGHVAQIAPAQLGEFAGALGAAYNALLHLPQKQNSESCVKNFS